MPTKIRIDDLEILRSAAAEKDQIIAELEEMVAALQAISAGAPSYDGQFAPRIKDLGAMEMAQIQGIIQRERESASYLRMKADAFEQAEQANLEGLAGLHAALWESVDRFGDASLMPLYLLRGSKPPHTSDLEWWHLTPYEREKYLESLRMDWARFLAGRSVSQVHDVRPTRELLEWEFDIYLFGLKAGYMAVPLAQQRLTAAGDYREHGYKDSERRIAQYMQLAFLGPAFSSMKHYNLCGLLAVGHSLDQSYQGVIKRYQILETPYYWEEVDAEGATHQRSSNSGEDLLLRNGSTSQQNLVDLYESYGWEANIVGMYKSDTEWWDPASSSVATADLVARRLNEGKTIIALVNLESSATAGTFGFLEASNAMHGGAHQQTNHFVEILEVFDTRDGGSVVRVFNPFLDREELYTWEHFSGAWDDANSTGRFRGVIASPPEAQPTP
ncbi:MAG TPA: hypothetical protein VJ123_10950 [Anaerolineales bacterium]|nr:hypothetical protein [Anaerolineales bacterium]